MAEAPRDLGRGEGEKSVVSRKKLIQQRTESLRRRLAYLTEELRSLPEDWRGRSYIAVEVRALEWVLRVIDSTDAEKLIEALKPPRQDEER